MENQKFNDPNKSKKEEAEKALSLIAYLINVLIPIIAFAAALVLVQIGIDYGWELVITLRAPIAIPPILMQIQATSSFFRYLSTMQYLRPLLIFFVLSWALFAGVFSIMNAFLYKKFGPSMYSQVDVPVSNLTPKK